MRRLVADICRRLDGIPLAIELAAARVRALSVQSIAERLDRSLPAADRRRPDRAAAPADAARADRLELRPPHGRRKARCSGASPCSPAASRSEAAEAVGAGGEIEARSVLDLLSRLVEKSLVALDMEGARYRLLETVRQYAHERLVESAEGDDARTRHLAFYLALAEKARPGLVGPEQRTWLARLDLERENLLSAHAWCDRAENGAESGLRLVCAIKPYWFNRGFSASGYQLTIEALARAGAQARSPARCGASQTPANSAFSRAGTRRRKSCSRKASRSRASWATRSAIAAVLQPLGMACLGRGDVAAARKHLTEALDLARELGNKRELAAALNALAQLHRMEGELDAAEPIYGDVVAIGARVARPRDRRHRAAESRDGLDRPRLDDVRSRACCSKCWRSRRRSAPSRPVQSAFEVSAGLAASRERNGTNAVRFYGAAEAQARETGLRRDPTDEAFLAPFIAQARGAGAAGVRAAEPGPCREQLRRGR